MFYEFGVLHLRISIKMGKIHFCSFYTKFHYTDVCSQSCYIKIEILIFFKFLWFWLIFFDFVWISLIFVDFLWFCLSFFNFVQFWQNSRKRNFFQSVFDLDLIIHQKKFLSKFFMCLIKSEWIWCGFFSLNYNQWNILLISCFW